MNMAQLAAMVNLEENKVKEILAPFRVKVEDIDWKALNVEAGQSVTVNARDNAFRKQIVNLKPKSIDDVREWVGIPQRSFSRRVTPEFGTIASLRPTVKIESATRRELYSVPRSAKLEVLDTPQRHAFMNAAQNLVFGKVSVTDAATPLFTAAKAHILARTFPFFFAPNIYVYANSTLVIDPSIASVLALRIRIWQGGKIVTPSYVSFHCYSVEGGIPVLIG